MKPITRLKISIERIKQNKVFQAVASADPKSIINKRYRTVKAGHLRLNRRLQQSTSAAIEEDGTRRTCPNCGEHYTGRFCPQCGQTGTWQRYTWRQAILNFLDIWGLGNRPIFRTVGELFWRPGYMIRDYLGGHRQFYFPPFKLVAVTVLLIVFVGMLIGNQNHSLLGMISEEIGLNEAQDWEGVKAFAEKFFARFNLSSTLLSLASALMWFIWFLSRNLLYECLFIGTVFFFCVWIAHLRVNRYNFVETYIFLTYVLAQFLLCMIPGELLSWAYDGIETVAKTGTASALMQGVYSGLMIVTNFLIKLYVCAVCFLLLLDFRQFFGLTWKSTLAHQLLTFVVGIAIVAGVTILASSLVENDFSGLANFVGIAIRILLVAHGFYYADKYLKKNKELVPSSVINCCKIAMLSILFIGQAEIEDEGSFILCLVNILLIVIYAIVSVALSLLPVVVYKRYHKTGLALLSLSAILLLVIIVV